MSVKFADDVGLSEGAVDLGGPTQEFLRLAVRELYESSMFSGEPERRVLVPNSKGKLYSVLAQFCMYIDNLILRPVGHIGCLPTPCSII